MPAHSSLRTFFSSLSVGHRDRNVTTEAQAGHSVDKWWSEINQTLWRVPIRRLAVVIKTKLYTVWGLLTSFIPRGKELGLLSFQVESDPGPKE